MTHIAFATYDQLPDLTPDDQLAAAALESADVRVDAVLWDEAGADWAAYDAVVLRSTWDYFQREDEFRAWLDQLDQQGAQVLNPLKIIWWNLDKHYLQDLAAAGVQITPTVWLPLGARAKLADLLAQKNWSKAVLKPTLSAGADETFVVTLETAAADQAKLDDLLTRKHAMVQPFMEEIEDEGEWSLIFFDGQYSHAALKRPANGDFRVQPHLGGSDQPATPPDWMRAQAQSIVEQVDGPPLYARVDGVAQGESLVLMELELVEPALFFSAAEGAAQRFAQALVAQLAPKETA